MYIYIYTRNIVPDVPQMFPAQGATAGAAQRGLATAPGHAGRDADLGAAEVQGEGLAAPR